MPVFRQFPGDRVIELGGGLLGALLADKDRPRGAAGRIPHERDRNRAQPVGTPGPRLTDLHGEAGRDLGRQSVLIHHRLLRLHIVRVVLGEGRVRHVEEPDQLPCGVDILAVGTDRAPCQSGSSPLTTNRN